ncbi:hypothetical protein NC651_023440 [Populus alba x Populus x berolinensis]|nr:hypothetical protein NC651_023440 [Populus alba x Populus x berolinensis]
MDHAGTILAPTLTSWNLQAENEVIKVGNSSTPSWTSWLKESVDGHKKKLERKDTKGRCSNSHITSIHRWIRPRFCYVVHLTIVYGLSGGIVHICHCLGNLIPFRPVRVAG